MNATFIGQVLTGAILAVLTSATLVGRILSMRDDKQAPSQTIENLNDRIDSWWIMIALLILAFIGGTPGLLCFFGFASFSALREFLSLIHTRKADHFALWAIFFIILPLQYYLIGIHWYGLSSILIPVFAFIGLPIFAALRGDAKDFMKRVSEVQWALMTCVYCLSHVPALTTLNIPGFEAKRPFLLAFLLIVVQGSDVLQYIWGKLFGRHKIAPSLSPSKTIEGFVGGALSATGLGAALYWLTPFSPIQAAGMAFVIVLMGFGGGLVMSAIKRDLGVKDWGDSIAGHGGFIDRLDSIIFAAPIFFHLTRYWFTV